MTMPSSRTTPPRTLVPPISTPMVNDKRAVPSLTITRIRDGALAQDYPFVAAGGGAFRAVRLGAAVGVTAFLVAAFLVAAFLVGAFFAAAALPTAVPAVVFLPGVASVAAAA